MFINAPVVSDARLVGEVTGEGGFHLGGPFDLHQTNEHAFDF
jgi:hypothetical protein